MINQTYSLYMLLFPDGYFYFGSTGNKKKRYKNHKEHLRDRAHVELIQEHYNQTKQLPEFIELGDGNEYDIECSEYYAIKMFIDDPMCLNSQIPWAPKYLKIKMEKGYKVANKEWNKDYNRNWYKSGLGKLNNSIDSARHYINHYTKLERQDMVDKWNTKLNERITARNEYKHKI